jgi:hypothetical protein
VPHEEALFRKDDARLRDDIAQMPPIARDERLEQSGQGTQQAAWERIHDQLLSLQQPPGAACSRGASGLLGATVSRRARVTAQQMRQKPAVNRTASRVPRRAVRHAVWITPRSI